MVARRRLDFTSPSKKRRTTNQPLVLYRGLRPEMKFFDTAIPYNSKTTLSTCVNLLSVGGSNGDRIGTRIKMYRIQARIYQTVNTTPVRIDIIIPNVPDVGPTISYASLTNHLVDRSIFTKYLHSGTTNAPLGYFLNHKLELPLTAKYGGNTGTDINHNAIYFVMSTPATETITCNVRVWYTDA